MLTTSIEYKLNRIEAKLDHLHDMTHAIADTLTALTIQDSDLKRLVAAGTTLQLKSNQLKQALDKALQETK